MRTFTILVLFFSCYVPILILSAIIPYISRKTESFGISIPQEEYDNSEVKKIRNNYCISVLAFGLVMSLFSLFTAFFGAKDATMIFLPIGTLVQLAIMFVFYLIGYKSMQSLKYSKKWAQDRPQIVVVDTEFRKKKLMVSPLWFVVYIIIILTTLFLGFFMYDKIPDRIPMHYNINGEVDSYTAKSYKVLFFAPVIQIFMTFLMAFVYWVIGKSKQQFDPSDIEKSIDQNRVFRYRWSAFIMLMGPLLLVVFLFLQLTFTGFIKDVRLVTIVPMVIVLIIVASSIVLSVTTGQGGSRVRLVTNKSGNAIFRDEDKFWKLGIFYYNPEDPAIFIEKRFGVGWTNNFARPITWVMLIGIIVVLPILIIVILKLLTS